MCGTGTAARADAVVSPVGVRPGSSASGGSQAVPAGWAGAACESTPTHLPRLRGQASAMARAPSPDQALAFSVVRSTARALFGV
jgi:hypothetical protein